MSVLERVPCDDVVEVFLFGPPEEMGDASRFEQLYINACKTVSALCESYLWHKDPFTLHKRFHNNNVSLNDAQPEYPSLFYGSCCYGDNIEDEWFVVYIVKELTKTYPNLIAKIVDNDGEFLLIEAADSLPSWADPSNCDNRVFFKGGSLHLIPPKDVDSCEDMSIGEALSTLLSNSDIFIVSSSIWNEIEERISGYPDKIKTMLHTTTVYTPVGVAALLKEDPKLISAAVHAFCNRDPIDMKICRAMKYFPPENRVNTSVTFTKCLYAMTIHNNFTADRRTGWNLPTPNSPQFKSHSLGVKLACGFEILVSQAKPDLPLESNKAWEAYLNSLKNRKYFGNLLEHSKQYNTLLENAKDYFLNNLDYIKVTPAIGKRILDMLNDITLDENVFRKNEANLPDDDSDDWLTLDPKELESLLQKRYGEKKFVSVNDDTNPDQFTKKINSFLEHMSSVDGVEFPNSETNGGSSELPVRPKRGIKVKKCSKTDNQNGSRSPSLNRKFKMDFDADQFSNTVQNILDFVIPEDNWNSDSESDFSNCDDEPSTNMFDLTPNQLENYMKEMDKQLAQTTIGKSFETSANNETNVDIDNNTLKNMLQSYKGEAGGSGPAGNILEPLGFTKFDHFSSIDEEVD